MMKKNTLLLTTLSLVIGLIITLGSTRIDNANRRFAQLEKCPGNNSNIVCNDWQYGYPMRFLHSNIMAAELQSFPSQTSVTGTAWVEFRPAAADWLIWSVVSAGGLGLLVYMMEKAGVNTGFMSKSSKRRK